MKKAYNSIMAAALTAMLAACGSSGKTVELTVSAEPKGEETTTLTLTADKDGYITIFDGTNLDGWRGYGKSYLPERWKIEDGALTLTKGEGEGGDIIFAHKFKNFELEIEWNISEGGNSGIFYLAQEVTTIDPEGRERLEPIYVSAPEYQVLDNENHPDAKLGRNNNRKSASLYDMLPAEPQNAKPYGEWNTAKIVVDNGTVAHYQNGVKVVEYQLWTPEWTALLQECKFSEAAWPTAFHLLNNCGGAEHAGLIGLQDHGDKVSYRNIRVKVLP